MNSAPFKSVLLMPMLLGFASMQSGCGRVSSSAAPTCNYPGSFKTVYDDPTSAYGSAQQIGFDLKGNVFTGIANTTGLTKLVTLRNAYGTSNWTIADNLAPPPSSTDGSVNDYAVDSTGAIYMAGAFSAAIYTHWIVRKSVDLGLSWSTVDDYTYQDFGGIGGSATNIFVDTNGDLFVSGFGGVAGSHAVSVVRRSRDRGASWTTVDHFQYTAGFDTAATVLVRNNLGEYIYASYGVDSSGYFHGIQRKSTNGGASFSTVSDYFPTANKNFTPSASLIATDGSYLVAGVQTAGAGNDGYWQVLRSTDRGVTFTVVDSYLAAPGQGPNGQLPYSMILDSRGYVLVAGYATDSAGNNHAVVRQSKTGASDWSSLVDYVHPSSTTGNYFYGMKMDPFGNIFASGGFRVGAVYRALVVKLSCN